MDCTSYWVFLTHEPIVLVVFFNNLLQESTLRGLITHGYSIVCCLELFKVQVFYGLQRFIGAGDFSPRAFLMYTLSAYFLKRVILAWTKTMDERSDRSNKSKDTEFFFQNNVSSLWPLLEVEKRNYKVHTFTGSNNYYFLYFRFIWIFTFRTTTLISGLLSWTMFISSLTKLESGSTLYILKLKIICLYNL